MTLTSAACPLTDVIEDQTAGSAGGPGPGSSTTSGSTGSGCRRGARTRSPTTAASSCAPSASTSEVTRLVQVAPERLDGWLADFASRHGGIVQDDDAGRRFAADGSWVELGPAPGRRLGLLLVRRGGYAVGIADGPALRVSKVGSRYVQGRTAAGGWSQHRFARRRDGQTRDLVNAAADVAVRLLVPQARELDAVVTGGDRALVALALQDARLRSLLTLVSERTLDVADPKLAVLREAVAQARAVPVTVHDVLRDAGGPERGLHRKE